MSALLSTRQVAELWGVSVPTVWRCVHAGQLKALRIPGGQLRFRPEDVDAALRPVEPRPLADGDVIVVRHGQAA